MVLSSSLLNLKHGRLQTHNMLKLEKKQNRNTRDAQKYSKHILKRERKKCFHSWNVYEHTHTEKYSSLRLREWSALPDLHSSRYIYMQEEMISAFLSSICWFFQCLFIAWHTHTVNVKKQLWYLVMNIVTLQHHSVSTGVYNLQYYLTAVVSFKLDCADTTMFPFHFQSQFWNSSACR